MIYFFVWVGACIYACVSMAVDVWICMGLTPAAVLCNSCVSVMFVCRWTMPKNERRKIESSSRALISKSK